MGRQHSEEAVQKSLMRKRIFFTTTGGSHKKFGTLYPNTVVLSDECNTIGNGTLGKLDYLRKQGWKVLDYRTSTTKETS